MNDFPLLPGIAIPRAIKNPPSTATIQTVSQANAVQPANAQAILNAGGLYVVQFRLTSAQILALQATPIQLIAGVPNFFIDIVSMTWRINQTTPFNTGIAGLLRYQNAGHQTAATFNVTTNVGANGAYCTKVPITTFSGAANTELAGVGIELTATTTSVGGAVNAAVGNIVFSLDPTT